MFNFWGSSIRKAEQYRTEYYEILDRIEQRIKRCKEISADHFDYLTNHENNLHKLIELGMKGNKQSDEMTNISYTG